MINDTCNARYECLFCGADFRTDTEEQWEKTDDKGVTLTLWCDSCAMDTKHFRQLTYLEMMSLFQRMNALEATVHRLGHSLEAVGLLAQSGTAKVSGFVDVMDRFQVGKEE